MAQVPEKKYFDIEGCFKAKRHENKAENEDCMLQTSKFRGFNY